MHLYACLQTPQLSSLDNSWSNKKTRNRSDAFAKVCLPRPLKLELVLHCGQYTCSMCLALQGRTRDVDIAAGSDANGSCLDADHNVIDEADVGMVGVEKGLIAG